MLVWLEAVAILSALAWGIRKLAAKADSIEDDSVGLVDPNTRDPYGTKFLSIWGGND